jgi:hypothetical protein
MRAAALRALPLLVALAAGIGGDSAARSGDDGAGNGGRRQWTEVNWPFAIDQWGSGRAFRCRAQSCGVTVDVYLRPKIGFCNCTAGVYDDAELDRVGDIELIGPQYSAVGQGRPVRVGWMKGRSRAFTVNGPYRPSTVAVAIAFNDKCDVAVATVTADADLARGAREALKFLNSDLVLKWAHAELGSDGS